MSVPGKHESREKQTEALAKDFFNLAKGKNFATLFKKFVSLPEYSKENRGQIKAREVGVII